MDDSLVSSLSLPTLPPDLFPDTPDSRGRNNRSTRNNNTANNRRDNQNTRSSPQTTPQTQLSWSYNPLLDEDNYSNAAPPVNNTRENNFPDEERELDIPSYNPLLD